MRTKAQLDASLRTFVKFPNEEINAHLSSGQEDNEFSSGGVYLIR